MSWYALEKIDEAVDETKELLLPFDLGTWARLAVIILLTGGGFSFFNVPTSMPSDTGTNDFSSTSSSSTAYAPQSSINPSAQIPDIGTAPATGLSTAGPPTNIVILAGLLILSLVLVLIYLASVFEFIFYQSLLDENVQIRENFRKHAKNGLRYFGFQLAYMALFLALIAVIAGMFAVNPVAGVLGLLLFIPLMVLWAIFGGLVHDFVLLNMIETRSGIIESWKNVWPDLKEQYRQLGMYILIRFFLNMAIGIATFIIVLLATLVLAIPFIILGFMFAAVSPALALIPAVIGIAIWIVLMLFIAVPFRTFFYHWLILIYHEFTS